MKMQTIKKSISINAPKQRVWDMLVLDEYNRIWYEDFSPGSHAVGEWKVGEELRFIGESDYGMISRVIVVDEPNALALQYTGCIMAGKDDFDSPEVEVMKGGRETYTLTGLDGVTVLDITSDITDDYFSTLNTNWDSALLKLKELAERQ